MRFSKLLVILGILLMIYSTIFGLQLEIVSDFENTTFDSSYTFKVGSFLLGAILVFIGFRVRRTEH